MKKDQVIKQFMAALHENVSYWQLLNDDRSLKEKLECCTFSILCILDGISISFDGDISKIDFSSKNIMLHELFYKDNDVE